MILCPLFIGSFLTFQGHINLVWNVLILPVLTIKQLACFEGQLKTIREPR
jgi:hypothetical protein